MAHNKKKTWKSTNANNINHNIVKTGTIENTGVRTILENSIYMRGGIENWLDDENQYALLKTIKIAKDFDKIMIMGFDDTYKNLVMAGQQKNGNCVQFVLNNYAKLLDDETVISMKFEYLCRYTNKITVQPIGTAGQLYGTNDDTPMCITVFNNGEN